jgi:hypothetical protein
MDCDLIRIASGASSQQGGLKECAVLVGRDQFPVTSAATASALPRRSAASGTTTVEW